MSIADELTYCDAFCTTFLWYLLCSIVEDTSAARTSSSCWSVNWNAWFCHANQSIGVSQSVVRWSQEQVCLDCTRIMN